MVTRKNNSVEKAFDILSAFSVHRQDMTATEVARQVGGNVATVHRFLLTLEEVGAIGRTARGRFCLGFRLAELGRSVAHNKLLAEAAQPHLDALSSNFREVAHIAVRNGKTATYLTRSLPNRSVQIGIDGGAVPLHCSAVGKVLLSGLGFPARQELVRALDLRRFTSRTVCEPVALIAHLDHVARQGYAVDNEEWEDGVRCVAVPLRDSRGAVAAALAISAPTSRFDDAILERCLIELTACAEQIGRALFVDSKGLPNKARPRGAFPHLKRVGDFIFISGTSARRTDDSFEGVMIEPDGRVLLDIRRQTKVVFTNIRDMLESVGASLADLAEVQAYLIDMKDYPGFNEAYGEFFDFEGPTRTTVAVGELPHPHQALMVRAIAYKPLSDRRTPT
jgi:2-aminomuconate deaminase